MDLTGEYTIKALRQDVWDALNDPEVLQKCIPGCEDLEKTSDTEFKAKLTIKIGALRAKMKGEVTLSEMDAPNSYRISGVGKGGIAGFAKGGAKVSLADAEGGCTLLTYEAQAELGGKLAAVGSRVIQAVSKKMADDFFGKFTAVVSGPEPQSELESEPASKMSKPEIKSPLIEPAIQTVEAGKDKVLPDWLKSGLVNASISVVAIVVVAALTNN